MRLVTLATPVGFAATGEADPNRLNFVVHFGTVLPSTSSVSRARVSVVLFILSLLLAPSAIHAARRGHERQHVIDAVIIHSLGGPDCRDGRRFFKQIDGDAAEWAKTFASLPGVSIHYVIGRDGTIVSAIPEDLAASHAIGWNQRSIGIELVNNGDGSDRFPDAQVGALLRLTREIRQRHPAIRPPNGFFATPMSIARCFRTRHSEPAVPHSAASSRSGRGVSLGRVQVGARTLRSGGKALLEPAEADPESVDGAAAFDDVN
ncbi:MAG: peptidoglycan recognition family protein [Vicinamibacterales bacterium]